MLEFAQLAFNIQYLTTQKIIQHPVQNASPMVR